MGRWARDEGVTSRSVPKLEHVIMEEREGMLAMRPQIVWEKRRRGKSRLGSMVLVFAKDFQESVGSEIWCHARLQFNCPNVEAVEDSL